MEGSFILAELSCIYSSHVESLLVYESSYVLKDIKRLFVSNGVPSLSGKKINHLILRVVH